MYQVYKLWIYALIYRPVGLAFDARGRLYVSSDATGEIFRVRYTNSAPGGSKSVSSRSRNSLSALAFAFAFVCITMAWD